MEILNDVYLHKIGQTDYVRDGKLHAGVNSPAVMVTSENDLADLSELYDPGTIAYTAGFENLWQLDAEKQWVSIC